MGIVNRIKNYLVNIPGWRTNRKIIVFESDDWGTIRMPSPEAFSQLLRKGIPVDKSQYDSFDSLEKKEDIEDLIGLLSEFRSKNGAVPVITTNMVMGNPDFSKIAEANFEIFYHQPLWESYQDYYGEDNKLTWKNAISDGFFQPQFHAREHLNSHLWLKDLKNGNKETITAFGHRFFGVKTKTSSNYQKNYLAAYRAESMQELSQMEVIINEGLNMFQKSFGFSSNTFIACNYVWPKELENFLHAQNIIALQGQTGQICPQPKKNGKPRIIRRYTGSKNSLGQIYTVRNVLFEPYLDKDKDWADHAMQQIKTAFFWGKPAIISTHRINYASNMSVPHRDRNLKQLERLLKKIMQTHPDVEFLSSDQLAKQIN